MLNGACIRTIGLRVATVLLVKQNSHYEFSRLSALNAWDAKMFVGLYEQSGRGKKAIFTLEMKEQIRAWAKETPTNLNAVLDKIKKT